MEELINYFIQNPKYIVYLSYGIICILRKIEDYTKQDDEVVWTKDVHEVSSTKDLLEESSDDAFITLFGYGIVYIIIILQP